MRIHEGRRFAGDRDDARTTQHLEESHPSYSPAAPSQARSKTVPEPDGERQQEPVQLVGQERMSDL